MFAKRHIFALKILDSEILLIGCAGAAEDIGRQILAYGRRIPKAEMFARVDAVDGDTIRAVADRFIYDQVQTSLVCENVGSSFSRIF